LTDTKGVDTEVQGLHFYWEEKVNETAYVPHVLPHVPVKRGTATVNVRFDTIKEIDIAPPPTAQDPPVLTITLRNGKAGKFALAIDGRFKGESEFGEVEVSARGLKKIVLK
ncbi:MAG: hypothetical protein ACREI3_02155, partial [Nitrospirales bacterium]